MLKEDENRYDYDYIEDGENGVSLWVAGKDGKPAINISIYINEDGVEVMLWPMKNYENLTDSPVGIVQLTFDEVERLK